MDQTAIQGNLSAFKLAGPRLALQKGDEEVLLSHILQHLGIEISPIQFQWHVHQLRQTFKSAELGVPLAKRFRVDRIPYHLEGLKTAEQFRETKGSAAENLPAVQQFLLVPKGQRRSRLMAKATQLTNADFEDYRASLYISIRFRALEPYYQFQCTAELAKVPCV